MEIMNKITTRFSTLMRLVVVLGLILGLGMEGQLNPVYAALSVTVEQASDQADPTTTSPVNFTVTFGEAIDPATFTPDDLTLGGTVAGNLSAVITEISPNDNTTFNIAVSGMNFSGTVTCSIEANRVKTLGGASFAKSTSTDNLVYYDHDHHVTIVEISTAEQFNEIRNDLGAFYRLMADIDLSAYTNWIPIGSGPSPFTGILDGNGKVISGLKITDTTGSNQGLFGVTGSSAWIKDLTIMNAAITAGDNAGILVGQNVGNILRVRVSGNISGDEYVGGLAGKNSGFITRSYSTATVTAVGSVGGLVGENSQTVSESYAVSPVLASVFNNYIQFDGNDDYILIPHDAAYETDSFTLEAWFQWDPAYIDNGPANNDADVQFIVGKGFEQFEIHTEGGSGENGIRFIPIPRTTVVGESSDAYHDVLDVIQPGWFHVATSWDFTSKTVRVYINGVQQDIYHWVTYPTLRRNDGPAPTVALKDPYTNPFAGNTFPLLIGVRSDISGNPGGMYFKGKIADVRFWNVVRSGEQIDASKNIQLNGNESGLIGYWKLNEASGTTALDSSTNGNNGILMNGASRVQEAITNVGGLIGVNIGTVTDSYYDLEVSGMSDTGKGEGKTSAQMKNVTTFALWDFNDTWQMTDGVTYPVFLSYTLNYMAGTNGSLSGISPQTISRGGVGSNITAVPDAGYHFVQWSDSNTDNPRQDKYVTGTITVSAEFALNQYTLTYTAGTGGTITGTVTQTVSHGSDGTEVTAVASEGYHFVQWSDGVLTASRTDTHITENLSVSAQFALNQYTLTYTAGTGGTITGTVTQTVNYGSDGTEVTAVASEGYHFVQWSDGVLTASRTDTHITGNLSVSAQFAVNEPHYLIFFPMFFQ